MPRCFPFIALLVLLPLAACDDTTSPPAPADAVVEAEPAPEEALAQID